MKKWQYSLMILIVVLSGLGITERGWAGIPTDPGPGGNGGAPNPGIPNGWSMNSSSSLGNGYAYAQGSINGDTMGIPDQVSSYANWHYQEGSGLFLTIDISTGGDLEKPTESVNLGTGGHLEVNDVTIEKVDDGQGGLWFYFRFDETLSVNWNGGYSSSIWTDKNGDKYSHGYLDGWASISPAGSLLATPEISFNHLDTPDPFVFGLNEYEANIRINGFIPAEAYTMSIVPEPASLALLVTGGVATYLRRRRIA